MKVGMLIASAGLCIGSALGAGAETLANFTINGGLYNSTDPGTNWDTIDITSGAGIVLAFDPSGIPGPSLDTSFAELGNGLGAAIGNHDYYSFTVTPDAFTTLTYTGLTIDLFKTSGATATVSASLLTSIGGFTEAALVDAVTLVGGGGESGAFFSRSFDLGTLPADVAAPVEFRLYLDDGGGANDANAVRVDNIVLTGDVTIPEPGSLALLGVSGLLVARRRRG